MANSIEILEKLGLSSIKVESLPTVLTLTCDLQFQFPASHDSDPRTCKKSKVKGQSFRKIEWKRTDRRTDERRRLHYLPC